MEDFFFVFLEKNRFFKSPRVELQNIEEREACLKFGIFLFFHSRLVNREDAETSCGVLDGMYWVMMSLYRRQRELVVGCTYVISTLLQSLLTWCD